MNPEVKEYIDKRIEDMIALRCASYFQTLERVIGSMDKNILEIMKILKKVIK